VALSEAEVEKSVEMGMATLEKLPQFRPDPAPKVALPKESAAPPPPAMEASGSTTKEVAPQDLSTQVGATARGRSQPEEAASREPDVVKVEMVLALSGEPSDMAEVA
jgi:hypothetical protein